MLDRLDSYLRGNPVLPDPYSSRQVYESVEVIHVLNTPTNQKGVTRQCTDCVHHSLFRLHGRQDRARYRSWLDARHELQQVGRGRVIPENLIERDQPRRRHSILRAPVSCIITELPAHDADDVLFRVPQEPQIVSDRYLIRVEIGRCLRNC